MDIEEPVFQGLLLLPPQDMIGKLKKTWQKKYCLLFKASNCGIERLETYDSREDYLIQQAPHKIVTLEACIKIVPSNQPRIFAVMTKNNTNTNTNTTYYFGCTTDGETRDWMTAFQQVAFKNNIPNKMIEEDNELYCSSDEGVFSVKLVETEASKRCKLEEKNYTLIISESDIKLKDNDTVLFEWPFRYIRKYGYRDNNFSFEAGRKCKSGEGVFHLERSNQQQIFRCISSKINSMKKLLRPEMISSAPAMDEAQYHAALHMEPGSRSPLPPTPINSDNLIDIDFSTGSQNAQKLLSFSSSYNFSTNSSSFIRSPTSIIKPKPAKPPRKYNLTGHNDVTTDPNYSELSCSGSYRKLNSYASPELPRKMTHTQEEQEEEEEKDDEEDERHPYDLVEVRSDAWRTLGVDTVVHVERKDQQKTEQSDSDIKFSRLVSDDDNSDDEETVKLVNNDDNDEKVNTADNRKQSINNNDFDCPYETVISSHSLTSTTNQERTTVAASPIIHNNLNKSNSTADYDQLQYFGSIYKLNNHSGYKKLNPIVGSSAKNQISSQSGQQKISADESNHSWADYELVEDLSSVRLADDSSRGYGVIRKKPNASGPQQKNYNNNEYAIVSKPKRV